MLFILHLIQSNRLILEKVINNKSSQLLVKNYWTIKTEEINK